MDPSVSPSHPFRVVKQHLHWLVPSASGVHWPFLRVNLGNVEIEPGNFLHLTFTILILHSD
jgi:hypothetical protein